MKKIFILLISLVVLLGACKSDSDVMATLKGDKITRGDFSNWLQQRRLSLESISKKKSKQKMRLRQIAIDKLTIKEAKKAGYEKNPDFIKLIRLVKDNFIAGYYKRMVRKESNFSEKVAKVSVIKFFVRNFKMLNKKRVKLNKAEFEQAVKKKMADAEKVLAELKKGKDFSELAKKYSNDYSRKRGGNLGFVAQGMRSKEFLKITDSLKKGEYTQKPVRIFNGIYIIKVTDRQLLTNDNIEDIVKNEKKAKRLKRRLQISSTNGALDKLGKAKDISSDFKKVNSRNPKDLIFKIGSFTYTVQDMNDFFNFVNKKRKSLGRSELKLTPDRKEKFVKRIFNEKLLVREAKRKGILKTKKFQNDWKMFYGFNLSGAYKADIILKDVSVSEDDIKAEYFKAKSRYDERKKRMLKQKKKNRLKPLKSYSALHDRIEKILKNKKKNVARKNWEANLLKKYNFKINEDMLEGK